MSVRERTVGRVAALTGLTVRALHHYDAIGLVSPSLRSAAGYRLYTDDDLRRLQQVLLFRELGFALDTTRELIDAPVDRRRAALRERRDAIEQQRRRADAVLRAVDATLHSLDTDTPMNTERGFDDYRQFMHGEYADEARERWGATDAWTSARRRTRDHTGDDWARIHAEGDALTGDFLDAMRRSDAADGAAAMAIAERHREYIDRYFYPCSHAMHAKVAAMYTEDERFRAHYDRHAEGLAAYIRAAVDANAAMRASE